METTLTFYSSSPRLVGLLDELEKIAQGQPPENPQPQEDRNAKRKNTIKTALILGAGAAVGGGAMTALDEVLSKHLGPRFNALPSSTKKFVVGPLVGLAATGSILAARKLREEHKLHEQ